MRMIKPMLLLAMLGLMGCVETTDSSTAQIKNPPKAPPKVSAAVADRNFNAVVAQVEPVAERECRRRTSGLNCDFLIKVDERADQPANAFQTRDKSQRPVIVFTRALIRDTRNRDELAFVLGHEASHHIRNHIPKTQQNAIAGAVLASVLVAAVGGGQGAIDAAGDVGATVGARSYSKNMELEADQLGTIITTRAGFDPVRGANYFFRIPDPGNRLLGSHPPNAARVDMVRKTSASLK